MISRSTFLSLAYRHSATISRRRLSASTKHGVETAARTSASARDRSGASEKSSRSASVLFGVPIAITFSLGVWQLYRLRRKERLIDERKNRLSAPPIEADSLFENADTDHRRIRLSGQFLHEHEMLVGPRSAPNDVPMPVLQWGGSTGLQVITPFRTADGRIVLINRGWIPQRISIRSRRENAHVNPYAFLTKVDQQTTFHHYSDRSPRSPQLSFVGVVRNTDERNRFTPENIPAKDEWFYVDADAMLRRQGLEGCDRIVELVEPYPQGGWPYPRGIELYAEFRTPPSTHITYAITWFSLSACIGLLTRFRVRQKHRV